MTQSVRRLIYLIAALCVAGFMLAACGDDNGTSKSADMYQQSDTLRVGVMGLPPMLGNP